MYKAIPTLILFTLFLTACNHPEEEQISGAFNAMQLFADSRAYPFDDIPSKGFFQAYEKALRDFPSDDGRADEPWKALGPMNIAGRALVVEINPQDNKTIYCGSASGGLWRSFNQGRGISWHKMPLGFPALGVSDISFAPNDSMTMFVSTGEVLNMNDAGNGAAYRPTRGTYGIGILKSTDGGETWTKSLDWAYEQKRGVWQVEVAPSNPNVVYAATTHGTYKSQDAGDTWSQVHDVPMGMDLVVHPTNEDIVFVGYGNLFSPSKGIYKTTDGGVSWEKAGSPIPTDFGGKIMLDIHEANPNLIYASIGNSTNSAEGYTWLCKSTDGGESWSVVNETDYSRFQGWFAHDVAIHPTNPNEIQCIGVEIWKSTNGGNTLTKKANGGVQMGQLPIGLPDGPSNYSHSDHHDVKYDITDPNIVYYANDGGIYVSEDGGETFESRNGGLNTTQFYNGLGVAQNYSGFCMGGLQDNSTVKYDNDPAWTRVIGGDGAWSAVNPFDHENNFGSWQRLNIMKHYGNNQYSNVGVPEIGNEITAFIAPFVISPSNPSIVYAGRSHLYKSADNGEFWEIMGGGNPINGDPIFAMEVSPTNENVLYFATAPLIQKPQVFVTTDGGITTKNITQNLPDRYINDITVNPEDPGHAFVTLGGFGSGHVYETTDYGDNWEDITYDLPDVPTSAVVVDPKFQTVYVGNDLGVYYKSLSGDLWNAYNEGIEDVTIVMDLKISDIDEKILVATHGAGVWENELIDVILDGTDDKKVNVQFASNVYPNPFSNSLTIELDESLQLQTVDVSIVDALGRSVYEEKNVNVIKDQLNIDNLGRLPVGSHTIRLETKEGIQARPIVKSQ